MQPNPSPLPSSGWNLYGVPRAGRIGGRVVPVVGGGRRRFHCEFMTESRRDSVPSGLPATHTLFSEIYADLRKRASILLASNQTSSLNTTGLVHEAYLKFSSSPQSPSSALHFFNIASAAMRQIIVDHARYLKANKRSSEAIVTLDDSLVEEGALDAVQTMRLSDALESLRASDARLAQIVDLHFFGGLGFSEIAKLFEVSLSTIEREWRTARALLYRDMTG